MLLVFTACSTPVQHKPELVANTLFEAFNRHDWKAMADVYADSALFLDPSLGTSFVMQTKTEIVKKYAELESTFPDVRDSITNIYPCGETVVVEFTSIGTALDGTKLSLPIVSVLTVKNGLIVKDATYYDL